jgi:ABC-type multidrug transport system ATPase subunit
MQMEGVIKVSKLQKRFGEVNAVDGLDFEIYRNEIFGIIFAVTYPGSEYI